MKKVYFLFFLSLMTMSAFSQWTTLNTGTTYGFHSIFFPNATTGYGVGGNSNQNIEYKSKTSDGGTNWTVLSGGATYSLSSVYFTDVNTGYAVGDTTILKTINGGTNWTAVSSGITNLLWSVYFSDVNTGYAVGGSLIWSDSGIDFVGKPYIGTILKTTNGGATWTSQLSGTIYRLYSVYFTNFNTGYAVGDGGTILKTITSGE